MAERTIATVLKTVEVKASGGSNPPPSALFDVSSHDLDAAVGWPDMLAGVQRDASLSGCRGEVPESG